MAFNDFPELILEGDDSESEIFRAIGGHAVCMKGTVGGNWRLQWRFKGTDNDWENYFPAITLTNDRKYAEFNGSQDLEYRIIGGTQDANDPTTAYLVRVPTVVFA